MSVRARKEGIGTGRDEGEEGVREIFGKKPFPARRKKKRVFKACSVAWLLRRQSTRECPGGNGFSKPAQWLGY
ncbi:MAG: hypothetical protein M1313_00225 [Nitrospirae bacterium]|nr:hypothetical protein [Nitrospirota bacterium]